MANKHFYRLLVDSETGRLLSDYWHRCLKCEREAEKYAKKMGGQFYYPDPKYFAGGVSYISFPDNKPSDPGMWREICTQYADGSTAFTDGTLVTDDGTRQRLDGPYKGAMDKGDVVYYEPNVTKHAETVEVPGADYQLQDTFDIIHDKRITEHDGKFYVRRVRFTYDEPKGRSGGSKTGVRTASRTMRRAIKAEVQRTRLPVTTVDGLLSLLRADLPERVVISETPTFFAYNEHYYIGCAWPCLSDDMTELTPQQYRTASDRYRHSVRS